jgi:hypothetical protein
MSKKAARHGGMWESLADWPGGNLAEDGINEVSCIIVCCYLRAMEARTRGSTELSIVYHLEKLALQEHTGKRAYASSWLAWEGQKNLCHVAQGCFNSKL